MPHIMYQKTTILNSQFSSLYLFQNLVMNSITILSRSDSFGTPEFL